VPGVSLSNPTATLDATTAIPDMARPSLGVAIATLDTPTRNDANRKPSGRVSRLSCPPRRREPALVH
jgi:hypothetical protein